MLVEQRSHLDKSIERLSYWDWLLEVSFRFCSGASDSREEKPPRVLNEGLTCPKFCKMPNCLCLASPKRHVSNSKGVENQQEEKATLLHTNCIVLRALFVKHSVFWDPLISLPPPNKLQPKHPPNLLCSNKYKFVFECKLMHTYIHEYLL